MIDEQTLDRIAEISRLKLSAQEKSELQKDLSSILQSFSKIREIEARGKELYYVRKVVNALRKDKARKKEEEAKGIRSQFNKREEEYMIAPKSL